MTRQLTVGIFRERRDTEAFVFKAPQYQQAYHEIIDLLNEKGVSVALLLGQSTYKGGNHFSKHWVQVNNNGRYTFEKHGPITVDVIFVKDFFVGDSRAFTLNTERFSNLCRDKHASYQLLHEFHPKSLIVHDKAELNQAMQQMPGERVAVKTLQGNSGEGVFVGLKNDVFGEEDLLQFPLQVQEFIETNVGVPGVTTKRHDVRVVMLGGEPILSTLRTPPEGGLKSNIGYGGETRLLDLAELPPALLQLCQAVDKKLAPYATHRLYSADFGHTAQGWKLFEVNATPGTVNRARGEQAWYYQDKLTDFLKQLAEIGRQKAEED